MIVDGIQYDIDDEFDEVLANSVDIIREHMDGTEERDFPSILINLRIISDCARDLERQMMSTKYPKIESDE